MTERTKAIVLNKIKYSDSAVIVNLYSHKYGRISVMAKGCYSKKSNTPAKLFFSLNIIEIDLYYKENRSVQLLKNATSITPLTNIATDIHKTCIAQFLAEVIQKSVKEETCNAELFTFLENAVNTLEKTANVIGNFHIIFLLKLASLLGFKITNNYCSHTPFFNIREGMFLPLYTCDEDSLDNIESNILSDFLKLELIKDFSIINVNYKERKSLLNCLIKYYQHHALNSQDIKSLGVLFDIFGE